MIQCVFLETSLVAGWKIKRSTVRDKRPGRRGPSRRSYGYDWESSRDGKQW